MVAENNMFKLQYARALIEFKTPEKALGLLKDLIDTDLAPMAYPLLANLIKPSKGFRLLKKAAKVYSDNIIILYNLGVHAEQWNKKDLAIECFSKCLALPIIISIYPVHYKYIRRKSTEYLRFLFWPKEWK